MVKYLEQKERDEILIKLSNEQRGFLRQQVKRGKRTKFANEMARQKGIFLPENISDEEIESLLDEWVLVDYIDNGYVSNELLCECGRALRYQYVVKNKQTNQIRKFGKNHFEEHTGIPANIVKEIVRGFDAIDYELDDILYKVSNKWNFADSFIFLPDDLELPTDIKAHLDLNLPLLDRQISRLRKLINEHMDKIPEINIRKEIEDDSFENTFTTFSDTDQVAFDLFDSIDNSKATTEFSFDAKPKEKAWKNDILPIEFEQYVDNYIKKGYSSARVISELLIKYNEAPNGRFLTGKPKIYLSVCRYLDQLVSQGTLTRISVDLVDRNYEV